jgi:hypothetical protein
MLKRILTISPHHGAPSKLRITSGAISARVTALFLQYWVGVQPNQKPRSRIFCTNLKNGSLARTSVK